MRELCQHQSSFSRQVQVFSRHHNIRPISEQMLGNTSYMTVHICDAQHFNAFCPRTPFFTLFILSRTSDNTTSQNIGGDQCMGRPPTSNCLGNRPPSPPRSPPLYKSKTDS